RTYRTPQDSRETPLVASRSVSPRKTLSSEEAVVSTRAETLSSTTGAMLRVDTLGPSALVVGEAARLIVRISNLGTTEVRSASVRISIPKSLEMHSSEVEDGSTRMQQESISGSFLIWTIDQVPARAERRLQLQVVPRTTDPLDLAVEWSVAPVSSVARIEVQQPRLELALQGPRELVYGETKVFTVTVSNPGNGDAKEVALRLALGDESADMLQVGTIPAGASRKYEVEVTARQAGPMAIVASAQAANNLQAEAQEQIAVRRADLKIETLGSGLKYAGSVGTYQIRVTNGGDAPADNIEASVRLPAAAKYVQGLEGAEQQGSDLRWPVGRLAAGEERTYRFFCQLSEEGDARFDFVVRDEAGLEAAGSVVTRVEAIADLKMIVNDPKGPIPVGEEVVYEVQITNRGTKEATGIQVVAQFSEGIEPSAAEGTKAEIVPGQVVFAPIARLNPNETIKLSVKAKADRDGNHVFRAELRCSDPEHRLVAEDATTFFGDDLLSSPVEPAKASPSDATAPTAERQSTWAPSSSRR
ncbi:MAG: hypothetical protein JJ992_09015, partial [Planctomycetes bacterium]|nr:hypothetical protein [Planctomycetota bacterium]